MPAEGHETPSSSSGSHSTASSPLRHSFPSGCHVGNDCCKAPPTRTAREDDEEEYEVGCEIPGLLGLKQVILKKALAMIKQEDLVEFAAWIQKVVGEISTNVVGAGPPATNGRKNARAKEYEDEDRRVKPRKGKGMDEELPPRNREPPKPRSPLSDRGIKQAESHLPSRMMKADDEVINILLEFSNKAAGSKTGKNGVVADQPPRNGETEKVVHASSPKESDAFHRPSTKAMGHDYLDSDPLAAPLGALYGGDQAYERLGGRGYEPALYGHHAVMKPSGAGLPSRTLPWPSDTASYTSASSLAHSGAPRPRHVVSVPSPSMYSENSENLLRGNGVCMPSSSPRDALGYPSPVPHGIKAEAGLGVERPAPAQLFKGSQKGEEGSRMTVDADGTLLRVIVAKISKHYIYYMEERSGDIHGRQAGKWTYFMGAAEKGSGRKVIFTGYKLPNATGPSTHVIAGVLRYNKDTARNAALVYDFKQDAFFLVSIASVERSVRAEFIHESAMPRLREKINQWINSPLRERDAFPRFQKPANQRREPVTNYGHEDYRNDLYKGGGVNPPSPPLPRPGLHPSLKVSPLLADPGAVSSMTALTIHSRPLAQSLPPPYASFPMSSSLPSAYAMADAPSRGYPNGASSLDAAQRTLSAAAAMHHVGNPYGLPYADDPRMTLAAMSRGGRSTSPPPMRYSAGPNLEYSQK